MKRIFTWRFDHNDKSLSVNPWAAFWVAVLILAVCFLFSGCAVLNPKTLTKPVFGENPPSSVFEITKGSQITTTDPKTNSVSTAVVPNDTLKVNQTFMQEGAVLGFQNSYFDPYAAHQLHYDALAKIGIAAASKEGGMTPAEAAFLEVVAAKGVDIQPVSILREENVTLSRTSDPTQAATVAKEQFAAMAAVSNRQTDAAGDVAKTGINAAFPASAVGQVASTVGEILKSRMEQKEAVANDNTTTTTATTE